MEMGRISKVIICLVVIVHSNVNAQKNIFDRKEFIINDSLYLIRDTLDLKYSLRNGHSIISTTGQRPGFYIYNANSKKRLNKNDRNQLLQGEILITKIYSYILLMDSNSVYFAYNSNDCHTTLKISGTDQIRLLYSYGGYKLPKWKYKRKKARIFVTYIGDNHFYRYNFIKKKNITKVKRTQLGLIRRN